MSFPDFVAGAVVAASLGAIAYAQHRCPTKIEYHRTVAAAPNKVCTRGHQEAMSGWMDREDGSLWFCVGEGTLENPYVPVQLKGDR
jgi:hypothetical protein